MKRAETYRVYELRTVVMIHSSMPEENDGRSVLALIKDIGALASGDVVIVSAVPVADDEDQEGLA